VSKAYESVDSHVRKRQNSDSGQNILEKVNQRTSSVAARGSRFSAGAHKLRLILITERITQAKIANQLPRFGNLECARNHFGLED
jgi:hypothetical protein